MKRALYCICLTAVIFFSLPAQAAQPKREMRATWLTTVMNIDWPSKSGLPAAEQQKELRRMLDSISILNLNTVFFQIRTNSDALYRSKYEPWSDVLTGVRGKDPGYDPLQFCIDECHKRGLACHAWMNPYRYSRTHAKWTGENSNPLNYEVSHPEWLLFYSNNIILNPGLKEVEQLIKNVVGDVVNNYDIDGIVFDDYFYPYGGTTTQDAATVKKYKPEDMSVGDWRRDNVRRMVKAVYDTIQSVKPWVAFGISPFGIWTTDQEVARAEGIVLPEGITGGNMYETIYCDPVSWLKDGTVDYISPQLYWPTGGKQDYTTLCQWWADLANSFGVQFYSSMALYRYAEKNKRNSAFTVSELAREQAINRTSSTDNAFGSVYYNTKAWYADKAFRREYKKELFRYAALPPAFGKKSATEQPAVSDLSLKGQKLSWKHAHSDSVHYSIYAVERSKQDVPHIWSQAESLLGVSYSESYTLPKHINRRDYAIGVGVLDGYGNEYSLKILGQETENMEATELLTPLNLQCRDSWQEVVFEWKEVYSADSYIVQIATDAEFKDILMSEELTETSFKATRRKNLMKRGAGIYYWRVKSRCPNEGDTWSESRIIVISA